MEPGGAGSCGGLWVVFTRCLESAVTKLPARQPAQDLPRPALTPVVPRCWWAEGWLFAAYGLLPVGASAVPEPALRSVCAMEKVTSPSSALSSPTERSASAAVTSVSCLKQMRLWRSWSHTHVGHYVCHHVLNAAVRKRWYRSKLTHSEVRE